jgi:hypothetical protein
MGPSGHHSGLLQPQCLCKMENKRQKWRRMSEDFQSEIKRKKLVCLTERLINFRLIGCELFSENSSLTKP